MAKRLLTILNYCIGRALLRLINARAAVEWFRRASRLDSHDDRAQNYLAFTLWRSGQLEESAVVYRKLLERQPSLSGAWHDYACVLQDLGRHADALDAVERAIALEPDNPDVHNTRGWSLVTLGRFEEAVGAYRRTVNLHPAHPQAVGNLGATLGELRRWEEAVRWHSRAMELERGAVPAHNLGVALFELDRFEEAEKAFREALTLEPGSPELQARLGLSIAGQDRVAEALDLLQAALVSHPHDPMIRSTLCNLLLGAGRRDEALDLTRESVRLRPADALGYQSLGWTHLECGQGTDALAAFDTAIRLKPGLPEFIAGRGAALSFLGRHREAVTLFQEVVAADSGYFERDDTAARYYETSMRQIREAQ